MLTELTQCYTCVNTHIFFRATHKTDVIKKVQGTPGSKVLLFLSREQPEGRGQPYKQYQITLIRVNINSYNNPVTASKLPPIGLHPCINSDDDAIEWDA